MSAVATHPRAVDLIKRGKLRRKVERVVSRLIAIIDELDSDPEAEPWLGAPEWTATTYVPGQGWRLMALPWAQGVNDDREDENEHGGDVLDESEEALGWNENVRQAGLSPNTADADLTAPERHGGGFVRCGPEEHEDDGWELPADAEEFNAESFKG